MGFFTKPEAGAAAQPVLAPLSHQRIIDRLDAQGFTYGVDDDGDIGGRWDDHLFYFFRLGADGEFLQVRGRWTREVPVSEADALTRAANQWNLDTLWPKAYVRVEGDDVGVYAEHVVSYEHGLTDEQLDLHMACGISTALQLFAHLDDLYPQAAETAKAQLAAYRASDAD
ncbi:YbjN domain-containing protein [Cellulomonas sp. NS3]|uniref:YbjN domain-containing protein n=1 Tax=Cellulomonas sp. NS3 TaxID=2973977 RepID=UPI0021629CBD|nr:YbjN domain-containing protein [Cellulomonas sp. NS3]